MGHLKRTSDRARGGPRSPRRGGQGGGPEASEQWLRVPWCRGRPRRKQGSGDSEAGRDPRHGRALELGALSWMSIWYMDTSGAAAGGVAQERSEVTSQAGETSGEGADDSIRRPEMLQVRPAGNGRPGS